MSSCQHEEECCLNMCDSFVMQLVFFIYLFLFFLCETLGIITVTWLPANGDLNKQPQSVLVGGKSFMAFWGVHNFKLTHLFVTHESPLIKNICLLLLGVYFLFLCKYLFCCSLAIQLVTFCFEGQELSIKTLIS